MYLGLRNGFGSGWIECASAWITPFCQHGGNEGCLVSVQLAGADVDL
jgi:hypothetical protein